MFCFIPIFIAPIILRLSHVLPSIEQSGQIFTFSEADLSDSVALSQSHRNHTYQMGMNFLLCVLLSSHGQRRVTTGRD